MHDPRTVEWTFTPATAATYRPYWRLAVTMHEKGDAEREQPASPSLVAALALHARAPGAAAPEDRLFRLQSGTPITARRYDTLFGRARPLLPWAPRTPVSAHVMRHTAVTAIGRIGGYPAAQAFAGHSAPTVTGRYLHTTLAGVAAAVSVMTGEPHPLAPTHAHGCRRR